jgi:hypothetical protein
MARRSSLLSTALLAAAAASCAVDAGDPGDFPAPLASPPPEQTDTAAQAVAITRFIPLRFIHLRSSCSSWTGCTIGHESQDNIKEAVDKANVIFEPAGVKFWIQSSEAYPTSYFNGSELTDEAKLTDAQRLSWQLVVAELRRIFPTIPGNAYPIDQKKGRNTWLDAAVAHYGDPNVYHIYVHDETRATQSVTKYPSQGRSMHLVAERLVDENKVPPEVTTHLAHELAHTLGMPHPWDPAGGNNPSTGQPFTYADFWDNVYCDLGASAQFYTSRANALNNPCQGTIRTINQITDEDLGTTQNCTTTPSGGAGVPSCTIEGVTYSPDSTSVLQGVVRADPSVIHNPPSAWRYSTNISGYQGYWGIDTRASAFLSASQLERIPSFLGWNDVRWDNLFERPDNSAPLGSLMDCTNWCYGIGRLSLLQELGTSTEDFVYWSNPSSGNMAFTFKATNVPVVGTSYLPVVGRFDDDYIDDILWYNPSSTTGRFWWGGWGGNVYGPGGDFTAETPLRYGFFPGTGFTTFTGDFNGDGKTDIFLYSPGGNDYILWNGGNATFTQEALSVGPGYVPIIGDFDGLHGDDIFWYNTAGGHLNRWYSTGGTTFTKLNFYAVDAGGPYVPVVGDFDGQHGDDIFWYKAGVGGDRLWYSLGNGSTSFTKVAGKDVVKTYTPVAGDFNGDWKTDIYWEADDLTTDFIWAGQAQATQFVSHEASVKGAFRPIAGNFDGMLGDDIFWYRR